MNSGFIKLIRSDGTRELLKDPKAFTLLTVIAFRARRTAKCNILNLQPGEALIGDYLNYGMSRQEYRTAKNRLKKWGFITFKATTKGTVASLANSNVYDINRDGQQPTEQPTEQPASNQQSNQQTTTNKECKNVKKEKKEKNVFGTLREYESVFLEIAVEEGIGLLDVYDCFCYYGARGFKYGRDGRDIKTEGQIRKALTAFVMKKKQREPPLQATV